MVDEALINELKEKLDAGAASAEPEDALKCFELYNQIAEEMEDLKEELEDMEISVQIILTDVDKKYWIKAVEGKLSYGDGEVDNPSFTFSATKEIGIGMLFGEVDATSAYMAGDITVEGNLQDAMAFQEIIELAMEGFEDIIDEM
ncbi:MAG: SCP2 sterol-binding domain-containing protein [Candidatus Lokiarchaeota archaeon]|nr:SCP2 sterol-binding domain-containing protein [Candidatus Lokiarchaeota archaeon]